MAEQRCNAKRGAGLGGSSMDDPECGSNPRNAESGLRSNVPDPGLFVPDSRRPGARANFHFNALCIAVSVQFWAR